MMDQVELARTLSDPLRRCRRRVVARLVVWRSLKVSLRAIELVGDTALGQGLIQHFADAFVQMPANAAPDPAAVIGRDRVKAEGLGRPFAVELELPPRRCRRAGSSRLR